MSAPFAAPDGVSVVLVLADVVAVSEADVEAELGSLDPGEFDGEDALPVELAGDVATSDEIAVWDPAIEALPPGEDVADPAMVEEGVRLLEPVLVGVRLAAAVPDVVPTFDPTGV